MSYAANTTSPNPTVKKIPKIHSKTDRLAVNILLFPNTANSANPTATNRDEVSIKSLFVILLVYIATLFCSLST